MGRSLKIRNLAAEIAKAHPEWSAELVALCAGCSTATARRAISDTDGTTRLSARAAARKEVQDAHRAQLLAGQKRRADRIAEMRAQGMTLAQIGGKLEMSRERVRQICVEFDIPAPETVNRMPPVNRTQIAAEMVKAGASVQDVVTALGLRSKDAAYYVRKAAGLPPLAPHFRTPDDVERAHPVFFAALRRGESVTSAAREAEIPHGPQGSRLLTRWLELGGTGIDLPAQAKIARMSAQERAEMWERRRVQMVQLRAEGKTWREVAFEMGVHWSVVRMWAQKFGLTVPRK